MPVSIRTAAAAVLSLAGLAHAQTSELFILDNSTTNTWVIQGGQVVRTFNRLTTSESAPAIRETVRTFGNSNGQLGREYDYLGNDLGTNYFNATGTGGFYDGTAGFATFDDEVPANFAFAYGTGEFWQFDETWSTGSVLFNTGNSQSIGSAYDTTDGTFWTVDWVSQLVHRDQTGATLGSWALGPGNHAAVAYDSADDTIWTIDNSGSGIISQYDKTGQQLQVLQVPGFNANNPLGAEFAIPAPGAAALLGVGGLVAGRRRRA